MQGEGDVGDLVGAVVGRDGLKARDVAHNERVGSRGRSLMWRRLQRFTRRLFPP